MTELVARLDGTARAFTQPALCDAWLADGLRFGDELPGLEADRVVGRWPSRLEMDVVVGLADAVGEAATWEACARTPPVAQKLAERARPTPLDREIARHLQHLQYVCHRPRLHLRVEEERLPVSRARRTPLRAVAELVSHPGDWEHRSLRSIQPSRVLARQTEDEWNLYENRVAVRLVDHLLEYLAERLEDLRMIQGVFDARREYDDEIRGTTYRRAQRLSALWSSTLESRTEDELRRTMAGLELAQRELQALLDAPLYLRVPRREHVNIVLKPTNILVNDPHYRKVAALWRVWVQHGHKDHETKSQRVARRQREATAWDRFVVHLVVRAFEALGWTAVAHGRGWNVTKRGWLPVHVVVEARGVVTAEVGDTSSKRRLRMLPLCADLSTADDVAVLEQVEALDDGPGEVVLVHGGRSVSLADADRATGWSFDQRAVLFACSPWNIDSEERMTRLLHGWLARAAARSYPVAEKVRALPSWPGTRDWVRYDGEHLVVLRAPKDHELREARAWAASCAKEQAAIAQRAKAAKQAYALAPREAIIVFERIIEDATTHLAGLATCPVCGGEGRVEARAGKKSDGADATWWATCAGCKSEWGTRPCGACGQRYRALSVGQPGLDVAAVAHASAALDWPDRVLGQDVWAQPCAGRPLEHYRCPECGHCPSDGCPRCSVRSGHHRGSGAVD